MKSVDVELTAKDATRGVERGDIIVVVDVLRCTSSIVTALHNGACSVTPVRYVSEARLLKTSKPESILAGERRGLPPKGFELGNSPRDFSSGRVKGKDIIMTTTSGTLAINNASRAEVVFIGSFLNMAAVAAKAAETATCMNRGLTIALSGKKGRFSLEDFLCAGGIVDSLQTGIGEWSDTALASSRAYRTASRASLRDAVLSGNHARELVALGLKEDVTLCCERSIYDVVPVLKEGKIVLPRSD